MIKKKLFFLILAIIMIIPLGSGCTKQSPDDNSSTAKSDSVTITTYNSADFQSKASEAEKWLKNNANTEEAESSQRYENDILAIGDSTYISLCCFETDGMVDRFRYVVEKYKKDEKTVIYNTFFSYDTCPFTLIKDESNIILYFMGLDIASLATWGDSGKIIVAYENGEAEIIEYSFSEDTETEVANNGLDKKKCRCEFMHLLKNNKIASVIAISAPQEIKYGGTTTRLFRFDDNLTPISATAINMEGMYEEKYFPNN
jgi:hypothetical protein